jgi:iron(III) transport system ATP-binding protein
MSECLLEVKNIECRYDGKAAVSDFSLHVNRGAVICLLGPSGCGKSTVLRAIAGLERVHSGEVLINERVVSSKSQHTPPEQRNIGMVFQDYALFPHLDIVENICFGLRRLNKSQKQKVANDLLELVGLGGFSDRFPHELSGGQQQRVALARALAPEPDLILLDEPFSNLDVDLRERLSLEVREILKARNTTAILVTHDQSEAFAVSDQIAVMNEGQIMQRDTAFNLYHDPANRFVADFIGQGVFLRGKLVSPESVETELGVITGDRAYHLPIGTELDVLVRPDDILPSDESKLRAVILGKHFKGAETIYTLRLDTGSEILTTFPSHHDHRVGDVICISSDIQHLIAFPL